MEHKHFTNKTQKTHKAIFATSFSWSKFFSHSLSFGKMAFPRLQNKPSSDLSGVCLDLHLCNLSGGGFCLRVSEDMLGGDLLKALHEQLPRKPGAILSLFFKDTKLTMSKTLKEQLCTTGDAPCVLYYVYFRRNAWWP